jgi:hypothetical protein
MVHFAIPIHAPLPLTLQGRAVGMHAITACAAMKNSSCMRLPRWTPSSCRCAMRTGRPGPRAVPAAVQFPPMAAGDPDSP